jgi:hypothetical protein
LAKTDRSGLCWFSEALLGSGGELNLLDLQWNPGLPLIIAFAISDGKVIIVQTGNSLEDYRSVTILGSNMLDATCLCWSPKGKVESMIRGTMQMILLINSN